MPDGRILMAVENLLEALGAYRRLLAGAWEAFGRLLEASNRLLKPKTVIATMFDEFKKEMRKFWGTILATFEKQKSYLFEIPGGYPKRS